MANAPPAAPGRPRWLTQPVETVRSRWGSVGVTVLAIVGLIALVMAAQAESKPFRAVGWGLIAALVLYWLYKLYGFTMKAR